MRERPGPGSPGSGAAVVVVGSVNVDFLVSVPRLPAPGETVIGGRFQQAPGGKGGNQAVAAARLGARTWLVGCVGDDDLGRQAREELRQAGVDTSLLGTGRAPTGVAAVLVDPGGENAIAVVSGANDELDPETVRAALASIPARDAVVLACEVAGLGPASVPDLLAAGAGAVVVTRGAEGADLYRPGRPVAHQPPFAVRAVDTTGAGDAFSAALAWALAAGRPLEEAVRLAAATAALSTRAVGARASLPDRATLDRFLARDEQGR